MIYSIFFVVLTALSYGYWRFKFLPAEVAQNAADFKRNGSADNLQRGYHGREMWSRVWPGLACCVGPVALPLVHGLVLVVLHWFGAADLPRWQSVAATALAFAAVAALLLGVFVRDFTPKLNLARLANGDTWVSEWTASGASKSWPDSAAWVQVRRQQYATPEAQQAAANAKMKATIIRTYRLCLLAATLLAGAAVVVAANS